MEKVLSKTTFSRLIGGLVLLGLCFGCSKNTQRETASTLPTFAPHDPYVSPFRVRKVALTVADITPQGESKTANPVIAVVDNVCAGRECVNEDVRDRISCRLFLSQEKRSLQAQYYDFTPPSGMALSELNRWANNDPCVIGLAPQEKYQSIGYYNDPLYVEQQDYVSALKFDQAAAALGVDNTLPVKVAVIDTGVGVNPDLGPSNAVPGILSREDLRSTAAKLVTCEGDIPLYTNENPSHPHGTFVAGIISATGNNSIGMVGFAQNAQILGYGIGDCHGLMSNLEVGNALMAASQAGAEVVNLSLGGPNDDVAIRHAIVTLLNQKTVIVPAAGNSFYDLRVKPFYPAQYASQYPGVITTAWGLQDGTVNLGDQASFGSNFSPEHVKISAPGTGMISTVPPIQTRMLEFAQGYAGGQGSSFAAPVVAAAAAITIGFLKKYEMDYDEQLVEYLITEKGANRVPAVEPYVKNGKVLDFKKLVDSLFYLKATGLSPKPITISGQSITYNEAHKAPEISFNANWNLEATHFGARIGVFDAGCGYSAPCLIQDYELSGNSGTKPFTLSRNELLPMLSETGNIEMPVYFTVAVFYKRPKPNEPGKFYNNFGIDALTRINVRDFDMSTVSSPFMGKVTNIRTDMRYMYVQGWSCVQGSNKAVPVEILDAAGTAIPSSFGYSYPLMSPHGGIFDGGFGGGRASPAFLASNIKLNFSNHTSYKAGWEASPLLLKDCRTLTVAQGFEFAIPFETIASLNLTNTRIRIRATHPNISSTKLILKDALENSEFTVPDVNYQPGLSSNVTLARASGNVTVSGSVCTKSPTPISVEFSFSSWDIACRLKRSSGFPGDFTDPCSLSIKLCPLPPLYTSELTSRNDYISYWYEPWRPEGQRTKNLKTTFSMSPAEAARHLALFPIRWPNIEIYPEEGAEYEPFHQEMIAKGLREVDTGDLLDRIQIGTLAIAAEGPDVRPLVSAFYQDRAGTSFKPMGASQFWDWYDVGEEYTPSVVAYELDETKPIGDLLFRSHAVKKIMRESKKYETPLSAYSFPLGQDQLSEGAPGDNSCPFRFSLNKEIDGLAGVSPKMSAYIRAFLRVGEPAEQFTAVDDPVLSMKEVPIDIRFFQDGVMILHLVSNFSTQTFRVPGFR